MFRFLRVLALSMMVLPLAWAALLRAPDQRSPSLDPPVIARNDPATLELTTTGEMLVTADWFDPIFRGRQDNELVSQDGFEPASPRGDRPKRSGGTYRTLCVRICDGFYFPISHSTSRERFGGDAKQCERRCPSRSRLFVHRNPGQDVDNMVDLDGLPYLSLPTAFLHRTQYVADCNCRGNPWSGAALAQHRTYAEAAKQIGKTTDRPLAAQSQRHVKAKDRWARNE